MKINSVHGHQFTQPRFGSHQRALKNDVEAAKLANSRSFGRQTNKSDDLVELKRNASQLDRQMQVQKALRERALKSDLKKAGRSNARRFGKQLQESDDAGSIKRRVPQKRRPTRSELASDMLETLQSTLSKEEQQALYLKAEKLAGGGDVEPVLGALICNLTADKMAQLPPGDSRVPLQKLSDSARSFLKLVKKQQTNAETRSARAPEKSESEEKDPYKKLAELRLKRFQEHHETQLQLAKIYSEMTAERVKTNAQIHQINADTAQAISEMQRKAYIQRMISSLNHHKSYLKMLTETE